MLIFNNLTVLEILLTLLIIITTYIVYSFTYWKRRNVPYLTPKRLFGHFPNPLLPNSQPIAIVIKDLYKQIKYEKHLKFAGIYALTQPILFISDLNVLKSILIKDFQYFIDRGSYHNEKDDPLSAHLFALGGQKWKQLRKKFTPTFTSGKMKQMFQTLVDCKSGLLQQINTKSHNQQPIDIKELTGRFTTNIIGSCAFGLECKSFNDDDDDDNESPFRRYGKEIFQLTKWKRLIIDSFATNFPKLAQSLHIRFFTKEITEFFMNTIKDTIDYRELNNIKRKDFLQLLIELKNNPDEHLTMNEITAQSVLFFIAGFETSSTTMTFTMYELAKNQAIQEKLREEINTVLEKYNNQITYDSINELKYMDQVINEALRKYPPAISITRLCVKDYQLPETDLIIQKGTRVIVPIYAIHHDPEYYPNPDQYDPDRFNDENSQKRHQLAHIPFGEGPRICIGMRFGLMQTKVGLAALLKDFKFTINKKTKEPLTIDKNAFVLSAEGDIWLNAEKI